MVHSSNMQTEFVVGVCDGKVESFFKATLQQQQKQHIPIQSKFHTNLSLSNSKFNSFKVHERKNLLHDKYTGTPITLVFTLVLDLTEKKKLKNSSTQKYTIFKFTYCRPTFKLCFVARLKIKRSLSHCPRLFVNSLIIQKLLSSSLLNDNFCFFPIILLLCFVQNTLYVNHLPSIGDTWCSQI